MRSSVKSFLLFISLIVFFEPAYFDMTESFVYIDRLYNLGLIIVTVLLLIKYINNSRFLIPLSEAPIFLFCITMIIATISGSHNYTDLIYNICMILGPFLFIRIHDSNDGDRIDKMIWWILTVILFINAITIVLYPNGITQSHKQGVYQAFGRWFLGGENVTGAVALPGVVFSILLYIREKKPRYLLSFILSEGTIFWTQSATSIIGGTIMLAYIIFNYVIDKLKVNQEAIKKTIRKTLIIFLILVFIIIVVLNNTGLFANIINGVFHKDLSLTGRLYVWDRVISLIKQSPIIGHGYVASATNVAIFGYAHPHDYYLNIAYEGGIIALFFWIMTVIISFRKSSECFFDESVQILTFGIISFLFMFITEVYNPLYIGGFYFMLFKLFFSKKGHEKESV